MKKSHIGVQMITLLPTIRQFGLYEAIRKCTEIGIFYFEVSQLPMNTENVAALQKAREELHIRIGSMSALLTDIHEAWKNPFDNLTDHFDKIVHDCNTLDCSVLRIGILPAEAVSSYESAVAFAENANVMAKRLKEHGIDMYYHTHHMEFAKYNGEYVLDIIKDHAKDIGFELDTHWIQRGGCDPVKTIERFAGRVRLLHLKDYRINGKKYAGSGFDIVEMAEVGEGNLPIKECIEAGIRSGCEFFYIKQDDCYGRDPLDSLRISYNNLVKMGYEDCFLPC